MYIDIDTRLRNDFMNAYLIVDSYVPKTEQSSITRVYISGRMTSALGICRTRKSRSTGKTESEIGISSRLMNASYPIQYRVGTLIHEILHSYFPTDHHGGKWKKYADIISKYTEYDIQRLANEEESEVLKNLSKYQCRCTKCGEMFGYDRLSDVVRNPYRYRHTKNGCGGSLERVK